MTERALFQDQLDSLAHGDVLPLLLVSDVHHNEGLWVEIALVDPSSATGQGYASMSVFRKDFPGAKPEEAEAARVATVLAFGERLRSVLAE